MSTLLHGDLRELNTTRSVNAVDLFCGAGGLSLGLIRVGIVPVLAIDCFEAAVETYKLNIGDHVRLDTIDESTDIPACDLIVGGPPCQGFSSAGQRRDGDNRNSLVSVFASIVAATRPKAFVFENVEGFLTTENGRRVIDLLTPLVEAGYRIHLQKVNAANFGVPQHRKRVIAIGGLGWDPSFPKITHFAYGAPGAHLAGEGLPPAPTVTDAFLGLPAAVSNGDEPAISDHRYRPLSDRDLQRSQLLEQGQRMGDLPREYQHDSYKRRANRRVLDGTPTERRGGAPAGVRRLKSDEPAKAITSGARTEFLHPTEHRNLTIRECARLQTFPDKFAFLGSLSDRAILVGNAVPPLLGETIGKQLCDEIVNATPEHSEGALLSFVPTMSDGMSPALRHTVDLVQRAFLNQGTKEHQLELWP